jgi:hypothetical protein
MPENPLIHDQRREAVPAIRGYVYQAYQSILAWIRLKESEVLYLEAAEDFDVHEGNLVETTQVKNTATNASVTLRSPDVVDAINNFWTHRELNPGKDVRLRFLTTANPGQESGFLFGSVSKGIEYWEWAAKDDRTPVNPIKNFLLSLDLNSNLRQFLSESDDHEIRDRLIRTIHWDTGNKPKDALIADILDRLVAYGEKQGVDSHHSEQALDLLLRKIAELLTSDGGRHVTRADFRRNFEEATMELIPRGELAALRRRAVGIVPELPSALLRGDGEKTFTTVQVLGGPLPIVREAVKRETLVTKLSDILRRQSTLIIRGSNGTGKTSVAWLVTEMIGGNWAWAGFRGHDGAQIASELRQAARDISSFGLPPRIVLDDLDLEAVSRFERELLAFMFSVRDSRGLLLITGPNRCPSQLLQRLWLEDDCNQEISYLDENDIKELIVNHGAPRQAELERLSRFIFISTGGHPQLAHARIRSLQRQDWPPLASLSPLQAADLQQERDLARRRLTEEMPSENTRILAYRLSLIVGQFSRQIAIALAEMAPPITLPGENFENLVGPWIERVATDVYRVSPLLQNAGDKVLSTAGTAGASCGGG